MGFGFGFDEFFGSNAKAAKKDTGSNIRLNLTITFEEAAFGIEKEIEFQREETCSRCNGKGAEPGTSPVKCSTCNGQGEVRQIRQTFLGQMVQTATCPACNGRGETIASPCKTCRGNGLERKTVKKKVPIPGGVDRGTQIRLAGEGGPGTPVTTLSPRLSLALLAPLLLSLFALAAPLFGGTDPYAALGGTTGVGLVRSAAFAWLVVRLSGWLRSRGLRFQL